ncbi:MAG: energy-coupling factor transporter transmembrane protein EcfT [Methanosarcinaceae archaeon]|nr:energy-coupling factor transporter transmembrane protein EcfT [Methanosarcinaceae archaeon]
MRSLFFTYIPGSSPLHILDPRTKIVAVMIASIVIFRSSSLTGIMCIGTVLLILFLISGVSYRVALASVRPMMVFLAIIFLMQLFMTGENAIFKLSGFKATWEGLHTGTLLITRFVYLLLFASLLTATTAPSMLTVGIERLLRPLPLRKTGISSFDLATMMSLSIHFVPLLHEKFEHLMDAQVSRGLDLKHDPFRTVHSLSVPMIRTALRSSEEVAFAMESRCYQGISRTSLFDPAIQKKDFLALSSFIALMWLILLLA